MTSHVRPQDGFRIAVDIGGTFTDCVVVATDGRRTVAKALTTPGALQDGVLEAVRVAADELGRDRASLLSETDLFVHGTTQATNAMLTRTGARTGLITTRGHEDAIVIGKVSSKVAGLPEREMIHASRLNKPEPIVPRQLIRGVTERIDRDGDVVVALQEVEVDAAIDQLVAEGVDAIAVCLLWSFMNEAHERRVGELLRDRAPGVFAVLSHQVAPVLGEYERAATTVVSAYVGPKVVSYLQSLEDTLSQEGLRHPMLVMQASGGLTSVLDAAERPLVTLDSGPTGGVLGCQHLGRLYGEPNVICTDVGGTSFDVGLILGGEVPLQTDPVVGQYTLRLPKVLVASIGSGGGSIAWLDEGGLLRVGPQSASSRPGPACYGRGGTAPTVTDADLVLGYIDAEHFIGGRMRLDRDLAVKALATVGGPLGMEPEEVALGIFRIINAQMADLIRKATVEQGNDPRECVLVAYGGAGPTHAAFYGADIGAKAILVLADSTAFSAEGMLTCDITHTAEGVTLVSDPFGEDELQRISGQFDVLEQRVRRQFDREGAGADEFALRRSLGMRFRQQVNGVDVEVANGPLSPPDGDRLIERFVDRYAQINGKGAVLEEGGIEAELFRVVGTRAIEPIAFTEHRATGDDSSRAVKGSRQVYFEPDGFVESNVYDGEALRTGDRLRGPAIIERMGASVVVPPGHDVSVDRYLTLRLDVPRAGGEQPVAFGGAGTGR